MTSLSGIRAEIGGRWTPLSGGLSHHVWRVAVPGAPDLTVRMTDGTAAPPLFARDPDAEWLALTALEGTGLAPRPVRRYPHAVVAEYVAGTIWDGDFPAAAATLRALHVQKAPKGLPQAPRCAVETGRRILMHCKDRSLSAAMPDSSPLTGPEVFLHGDPAPGNIVMRRGQAHLIDWQCPSRGPALHDVAMFLSPAMQILGRGRVATSAECDAFHKAYGPIPDTATAPLHWRMACHCQWRIEQGHEAYRPALQAELTALARSTRPR